ncbi:MAG: CdaR family protein [Thermomicrobiales bacterium]
MLNSIREHLDGRVTKTDGIRLASSLVLALLLWGWVTTAQDPDIDREFPNVEITVEDLPGELQLISSLPTASVTLTGPRSVINGISQTQVTAHLELNEITAPDVYNVPVIVSYPEGVWDHTVSPERVPIEVEQTVTDQFGLSYQQQGEPDASVQIDEVDMEVSEVTVRGPASAVDRVSQVILPIELGDRSREFTDDFAPMALDVEGQHIPEVEIAPERVQATVQVTTRGKNVAVITQLVGEPAQGYEIVDRQIIPITVLVDGPEDVLAELVAIQTEPVDVADLTTTTRRSARLVGIPEGIRVIEPANGAVDVVIQIRQRGVRQQLPSQRVVVTNLGPNLAADVSPGDVAINVVASEEALSQLPASVIEVQVDAAGLGPGTYTLRPKVVLPPNAQWLSTEPDVVTLTIRSVEPATPPASPSPASPVSSPVPSA